MANPRAVLGAIQTGDNKGQHPHTDPEQDKNSQSRGSKVSGEDTLCEASGGSRWRAVNNPIIMEIIANFLSDKDLVSLCLTSKKTKKIVDLMDSSCWRKRAKKLEAVLRLHTCDTVSTPYKERYILLRPEVERLANRIRGMIEDNSGVIDVHPERRKYKRMGLEELANIASLVHHDMIGEVSIKALELWSGNLSTIAPEQLGSLASCVTDTVLIGMDTFIPDLGVLLDKVNSNKIEVCLGDETLRTDEILALVRAMQTRVKTVILYDETVVVKTLLKTYDRKGKCEEVRVVLMDAIETTEEENMRQLAQNIDWEVDVTVESVELYKTEIIFKRK